MLLVKLIDDLLLAGARNELENFATAMKARFSIGKVVIYDTIMFNGCLITQTKEGDIHPSMSQYLENIKPALATPGAPVDLDSAKDLEVHDFWRLAGELVLLGSGALPRTAYFGSRFQQRVSHFRKSVHHRSEKEAETP